MSIVSAATTSFGFDEKLVECVIWTEPLFDPELVSNVLIPELLNFVT